MQECLSKCSNTADLDVAICLKSVMLESVKATTDTDTMVPADPENHRDLGSVSHNSGHVQFMTSRTVTFKYPNGRTL